MAEVMTTIARINPILKEWYLPGLLMQLPQDYAFYSEVKAAPPDVIRGKYGVFAVQTGRNQGGGPRPENAILPDPGSVEYNQMRVNVAYEHQLFSITQQAIEAAKTDRASFAAQLDAQIEGAMDAMARRCSRWMCISDSSGCVGNVGVTVASLTAQLVDGPQGFATQHLELGMVIDILVRATGATIVNGNGRTITAIDNTAKTITLDAAGGVVTTAVGQGVYLERSRNSAPMGILGIISDVDPATINGTGVAALQNTPVAGNPWFKSIVGRNPAAAGTPRPLTLSDLQSIWLTIYTRSGARKASEYVLWSRPELWDEYGQLLIPDRRYAAVDVKMDGGFPALEFNSIKFKYDRDFAPGNIYFHNKETTVLLQMGTGPNWVEGPNGQVLWWVLDALSYKACLYWFHTLAVRYRNRNGVLADLRQGEITSQ